MRAIHDYFVADNAVVIGDVVLGPEVNLWYGVTVRGDIARITLGARANIQDGSVLHTDYDSPLDIEEGVVVGHGVVLHGRRVGRDTLIGMGAILLSGCDIGPECVIAAGSLIPEGKRIPARSVVMGVPGKVVREVTDHDLRRTREICASYIEQARRHARGEVRPPWTA